MKFKSEHLTLAELGRVFGVSEKNVGKWLTELRLRSPRGYPMDASYVKFLKPQTWGQAHVWIAERTVEVLMMNGWNPVMPPPPDLVEPAPLDGPFIIKACPNGLHEVVGQKGAVAWVSGDRNAHQVCRLLNAGHRLGVLDRPQPEQLPETQPAKRSAPFETAEFIIV
ncbi:MAG: hypothetical protein WCJ09_16115 [Planctomycetota bacterium]